MLTNVDDYSAAAQLVNERIKFDQNRPWLWAYAVSVMTPYAYIARINSRQVTDAEIAEVQKSVD